MYSDTFFCLFLTDSAGLLVWLPENCLNYLSLKDFASGCESSVISNKANLPMDANFAGNNFAKSIQEADLVSLALIVDMHFVTGLSIGSSFPAVLSSKDCYFRQQKTTWQ